MFFPTPFYIFLDEPKETTIKFFKYIFFFLQKETTFPVKSHFGQSILSNGQTYVLASQAKIFLFIQVNEDMKINSWNAFIPLISSGIFPVCFKQRAVIFLDVSLYQSTDISLILGLVCLFAYIGCSIPFQQSESLQQGWINYDDDSIREVSPILKQRVENHPYFLK